MPVLSWVEHRLAAAPFDSARYQVSAAHARRVRSSGAALFLLSVSAREDAAAALSWLASTRQDLHVFSPPALLPSPESSPACLRRGLRTLRSGGTVAVLVPANLDLTRWEPLTRLAGAAFIQTITVAAPGLLRFGCRRILAGHPIPALRWKDLCRQSQALPHAYWRLNLLRATAKKRPALLLPNFSPDPATLAALADPDELRREIDTLPQDALLLDQHGMRVYLAAARQIPTALDEIGRLRESAFRLEGEGTGQPRDLDRFDSSYLHLFLWNPTRAEIAGAYRIGCTDRILATQGAQGIYSTTLFQFPNDWWRRTRHALELGRSFVRPEYQKSFSSLLLLWKGIGQLLVRNPRYRYLFGPVSISNRYTQASRELMVQFFRLTAPVDFGSIRPRHAFKPHVLPRRHLDAIKTFAREIDLFDLAIADMDSENKGMPVLLRQYASLGGRFLEFNVDPAFSHVVDGLVLVDLPSADPRLLKRYLTQDGAQSYLKFHQGQRPTTRSA